MMPGMEANQRPKINARINPRGLVMLTKATGVMIALSSLIRERRTPF